MTWVRLDDEFPEHPKIIGLSDRAFRAHVTAIVYCGRFLTDGRVPRGSLPPPRILAELVEAGLWSSNGTGDYEIHDYLIYQPTREEVLAERDERRDQRVAAGKARAANAQRVAGRFASGSLETPPPTDPAENQRENQRATSPVPVPVPHRSKPRAERERNVAFDALAEATGSDPKKLTRSAARTVGVALAEIMEAAGAGTHETLAAMIRQAAFRFRQRHPDWELTPMSLAKWWGTVQEIVPEPQSTRTIGLGAVKIQTWEGDPPWVREGLTWEQWKERHERDLRQTDVGPDPAHLETGLPSGGLPSGEVESGPAPPAEETG